jgi:hypothetical protein
VGLRAGRDDVEKRKFLTLPGLELRPLGHSARSQSLYRLRYPVSLPYENIIIIVVFMSLEHCFSTCGKTVPSQFPPLTRYHQAGETKVSEIGRAYSTLGRDEKFKFSPDV